jgi:hypothetical protein
MSQEIDRSHQVSRRDLGTFLTKSFIQPYLRYIELPVRKLENRIFLDILNVQVELNICDEAMTKITQHLERFGNETRIVLAPDKHEDHLDWQAVLYFVMEKLPQLYPYLVMVAAKDTWGSSKMRMMAYFFMGAIMLFQRPEKEKTPGENMVILKHQMNKIEHFMNHGKSTVAMARQPGRGAESNDLPAVVGTKSSLLICLHLDDPEPTFYKDNSGVPEFEMMKQQFSAARQRKEKVTMTVTIHPQDVIPVWEEVQGEDQQPHVFRRSSKEVKEDFTRAMNGLAQK